jgi:small-conductance mechanosensitive channel
MQETQINATFSWQDALTLTYNEFFGSLMTALPQIMTAILLVVVGIATAYLLRLLVFRMIHGFDWLFKLASRSDPADRSQLQRSYAGIASRLVFWLVLILFITSAAKVLGWSLFDGWLKSFVTYLPRLITGTLIILLAFLFSDVIRSAVAKAAASAQFRDSDLLAKTVQIAVILTAIVMGIQQFGIDVSFITAAFVVFTAVLLAGGAMAFAFGAKTFVANVIGAQFARKYCRMGEHIQLDGADGDIIDITHTVIVIETQQGRVVIPAKLFHEKTSVFISDTSEIK